MVNKTVARVNDGEFEGHWIPNGCPNYQLIDGQVSGSGVMLASSTSAGAGLAQSMWNAPVGAGGQESGQTVPALFIEGDTTTAASGIGNSYRLELIANWEVIPDYPISVIYPLTASPYDVVQLQDSLNMMQISPPAVCRQSTTSGMVEGSSVTGTILPSLNEILDPLSAAAKEGLRLYLRYQASKMSSARNPIGRRIEL